MDRLREMVNQRLAASESRRGFLVRLGQLALAGGALAAGVGGKTALADCGCCPNCGSGCQAPLGLTCSDGNPVCCFTGGYYYSYTPCTGCTPRGVCCTGSTNCSGRLSTCGFAPVRAAG